MSDTKARLGKFHSERANIVKPAHQPNIDSTNCNISTDNMFFLRYALRGEMRLCFCFKILIKCIQLDAFYQYLEAEAQAHFTAQGIPQKEHIVGADITVGGINIGLVGWLDDIGPFGVEFAEPRFRITHCRLKNLRWIGAEKQHLSVSIDDSTAPPLRAIMFHCADTPLGQTLKQQGVEGVFQLVGRVQKDSYRGGDAVQFMIEDIAVQPAF